MPESKSELRKLYALAKAVADACPEGKPIPKVTYSRDMIGTTLVWDGRVSGRYIDHFGTKVLHAGSLSFWGEQQYYSINEANEGN